MIHSNKYKASHIKTSDILDSCKISRLLLEPLSSLDVLMGRYPKYPIKVLWRAMEREERKGLIDCGVSLRCAWVVER